MKEYAGTQQEEAIIESFKSFIDAFYNVHFDNYMNISCNFKTMIKRGEITTLSYSESVNKYLDRYSKHVPKSIWSCDVINLSV